MSALPEGSGSCQRATKTARRVEGYRTPVQQLASRWRLTHRASKRTPVVVAWRLRPDIPWQGGPPVTTSTSPGCGYTLLRRIRRTKAPTYVWATASPLKMRFAIHITLHTGHRWPHCTPGNVARHHTYSLRRKANEIGNELTCAYTYAYAYTRMHAHACKHMHRCKTARIHVRMRSSLLGLILRIRDESTRKGYRSRWTFGRVPVLCIYGAPYPGCTTSASH